MSCCGKQILTICDAFLCEDTYLIGVLDNGETVTLYPAGEGEYAYTFSNGMEILTVFTLDVLPIRPIWINACNLLPNICYQFTIKNITTGYEYPYCVNITFKIKKIYDPECC